MIVKEIIFYGMKRNQLKRETNECLGETIRCNLRDRAGRNVDVKLINVKT